MEATEFFKRVNGHYEKREWKPNFDSCFIFPVENSINDLTDDEIQDIFRRVIKGDTADLEPLMITQDSLDGVTARCRLIPLSRRDQRYAQWVIYLENSDKRQVTPFALSFFEAPL